MIEGVEILCKVESAGLDWLIVAFSVLAFVAACATFEADEFAQFAVLALVALMFCALGINITEAKQNYTIVKVSPSASYTEFIAVYEVIEQHDDIYFVRPLEVEKNEST